MQPKFLLVRFSPGAAGRFLSSLLMGSEDVAHYDPAVKTFDDKILYIKNSFTSDLGNWLLTEPSDKIAWNITFVSNKYSRGDNLTIEEFNSLAEKNCTEWYHTNVALGKKIIIPWNKVNIPVFYQHQSVTILLDKKSRRWFNRAHWIKHFGIHEGKIHLKENDPKVHRKPLDAIVASFDNPIYIDEPFFSFVKQNVIKSEKAIPFYDYKNFKDVENDVPVNLSAILNKEECINAIENICNKLNIAQVNKDYITIAHDHWRNLHPF